MIVTDAFIMELGDKLGCEVRRTVKELPNGGCREGITIDVGVKISPIVYTDNMSEDTTVEDVARVFEQIKDKCIKHAELVEGINKESVLSNLMPCVVKTEGNEKFLDRLYNRQFDDMSVFYKYVLKADDEGMETISVTPDMLDTMGISDAELTEASLSYVGKHFKCRNLGEVIASFLGCDASDFALESEGVYMLSNEFNVWGAGCIVSNMLMESISKSLFDGGQFVIIPSSVHEVLIIGTDAGLEGQAMAEMITDINREHVKSEEQLSDHAYLWDGAKVVRM